MSDGFSVDQAGSINLKKASSGPVVSLKSSVKAAFRTTSRTWCLQAIQKICLPRSSYRIVQQPLWTLVLEDVVEATPRVQSIQGRHDWSLTYLWKSLGTNNLVQWQHHQERRFLPRTGACCRSWSQEVKTAEEVRYKEFVLIFILYRIVCSKLCC